MGIWCVYIYKYMYTRNAVILWESVEHAIVHVACRRRAWTRPDKTGEVAGPNPLSRKLLKDILKERFYL